MQKSVLNGSIALIISGLFCKVLGAFFRIPLTTIIGAEGIGVFQMVMSLYSFALILCSGGITLTLSTLISKARQKNDKTKIFSLYKISIIFSVLVAGLVGILFFLLAKNIAFLQGNNATALSYRLMIVLLPLGGLLACIKGVIQGNENMIPTAISQIIEQFLKFFLGIVFSYVLIKYGLDYGVFGAFLGIVVGEIFALVYLLACVKRLSLGMKGKNYKDFFKTLFPILIGGSVLPLVAAIDSFLVINRLKVAGFTTLNATTLFGIQTGMVGTILNLPLIISTSIVMSILPSLSRIEDEKIFFEKTEKAFKILWITILPMTLGIVAISKPLYLLLYPNLRPIELSYAVNLTRISAVSTILFALSQIFIVILQARGEFWFATLTQIIGGTLKLIVVIIFCGVKEVNIYGLAISNVALSSFVCVCCLIRFKGKLLISYFDLFTPLFASALMMFLVYAFIQVITVSLVFSILFSVLIGVVVYVIIAMPCLISVFKTFIKKRNRKEV